MIAKFSVVLILLLSLLAKAYLATSKQTRLLKPCKKRGKKCSKHKKCCEKNDRCYSKKRKGSKKKCYKCKEVGESCSRSVMCCPGTFCNKETKTCTLKGCGDCKGDYKPLTDKTINDAVKLWFSNKANAEKKYGKIKCWDVSKVTDIDDLFYDRDSFDEDLTCWDTSNIKSMYSVFGEAVKFNGDISTWNVQSVTDMSYMFLWAESFNSKISKWNVNNVQYMDNMFAGTPFNLDISMWNVQSVTTMEGMFLWAVEDHGFNQDISAWNIDNVKYMQHMFSHNWDFDQKLCWDVSEAKVNDMFEHGYGCIEDSCCEFCNVTVLCNDTTLYPTPYDS